MAISCSVGLVVVSGSTISSTEELTIPTTAPMIPAVASATPAIAAANPPGL